MAVEVVMPKLGLTMTEGKIVRWLKKEGEWVEKGEPLLEVLTEKVSTEVESPGQGYLAKVLFNKDDVVPVTKLIAIIALKDEDISDYEKVVEIDDMESKTDTDCEFIQGAQQLQAEPIGQLDAIKLKASPLAKRIAVDNGYTIDELKVIAGTGPGGRIVKKDVIAFIADKERKSDQDSTESIPLTNTRQVIAQRMTQSWTSTPHFYLETEVTAFNIKEMRSMLNMKLKKSDVSLSINDLIVKITATVLRKHKYINASYGQDCILLKNEINIGVAVGLEAGLLVPVIKNADQKGLEQIATETKDMIVRARDGKLSMEDITGGTFTISNLGMFCIDSFTAIINPPESAILSVGKISDKVVFDNGDINTIPVFKITVGFDHRVVDGLTGSLFIEDLKETLENPYIMTL